MSDLTEEQENKIRLRAMSDAELDRHIADLEEKKSLSEQAFRVLVLRYLKAISEKLGIEIK